MNGTRALVGVTGALVTVAGLQFWAMRSQLDVMQRQLTEMRDTTSITKSQIAAKMKFEIDRDASIENGKIVGWKATPHWENSGTTDAIDFVGSDSLRYFPNSAGDDEAVNMKPIKPAGASLANVTSGESIYQSTDRVSMNDAVNAFEGRGKILFWGYSEWRDTFNGSQIHYRYWRSKLNFERVNGTLALKLPQYYNSKCNRTH